MPGSCPTSASGSGVVSHCLGRARAWTRCTPERVSGATRSTGRAGRCLIVDDRHV